MSVSNYPRFQWIRPSNGLFLHDPSGVPHYSIEHSIEHSISLRVSGGLGQGSYPLKTTPWVNVTLFNSLGPDVFINSMSYHHPREGGILPWRQVWEQMASVLYIHAGT